MVNIDEVDRQPEKHDIKTFIGVHAGHAITRRPCDLSLESTQSKSSTTTLCSNA